MTATDFSRRRDITLDQQQALRTAAANLAETFGGMLGQETIERYLYSSYDEYAGRASVVNFLPLIAERFARQRLRALARVEGKAWSGVPSVLFMCVHNAGRSQMALGFFNALVGERAVGWSGGSEPGSRVNPLAVAAMAERGIDITGEFPKPWTEEFLLASDVVITMGCGDSCPIYPGKRYLDWDLADPAEQDLATVRVIRDDIERRVRSLVDELGVTSAR
jgi:protein-tyrosine-phosphatase